MLQSFILADGQTCLKALLSWRNNPVTSCHSVYPQGNFDWAEAAERIATAWMAGLTMKHGTLPEDLSNGVEALAATA